MPAGQRSALGYLNEGAVRIEDEPIPHYIAENDRRTSLGLPYAPGGRTRLGPRAPAAPEQRVRKLLRH